MRVQVPQEQSRFFDGRKIRVSSSSRKYRAALIFNREEELENFSVVKRVGTNGNSGEQSRIEDIARPLLSIQLHCYPGTFDTPTDLQSQWLSTQLTSQPRNNRGKPQETAVALWIQPRGHLFRDSPQSLSRFHGPHLRCSQPFTIEKIASMAILILSIGGGGEKNNN